MNHYYYEILKTTNPEYEPYCNAFNFFFSLEAALVPVLVVVMAAIKLINRC